MFIKGITLGSDPELFVFDKLEQKFVVSLDLVGGTKQKPRPLNRGVFIQEDGHAVEFNSVPKGDRAGFISSIEEGIEEVQGAFHDPRFEARIQTSHNFEPAQLKDRRVQEIGCDPDRNAWKEGKFNTLCKFPSDGLRTGGGHIHVGYLLEDDGIDKAQINRAIVKWQDLFLGVPSILMDKDNKRRQLYGKAGAYRDKPYGVEYRTLSSFWLASKEKIGWAYDQTMRAIDKVNAAEFIGEDDSKLIQYTINNASIGDANHLLKKYNLQVA